MSALLRKLFALFLVLGLAGMSVSCEASGEIDDDGVELEVDDD